MLVWRLSLALVQKYGFNCQKRGKYKIYFSVSYSFLYNPEKRQLHSLSIDKFRDLQCSRLFLGLSNWQPKIFTYSLEVICKVVHIILGTYLHLLPVISIKVELSWLETLGNLISLCHAINKSDTKFMGSFSFAQHQRERIKKRAQFYFQNPQNS